MTKLCWLVHTILGGIPRNTLSGEIDGKGAELTILSDLQDKKIELEMKRETGDADGIRKLEGEIEQLGSKVEQAAAIAPKPIVPPAIIRKEMSPQNTRSGEVNPVAAIPGVVRFIRIVMVSLVKLFPKAGWARAWKKMSPQDKLDRTIRVYAPFVESFFMGVAYWGITLLAQVALPMVGLDPGLLSNVTILSVLTSITANFGLSQKEGAVQIIANGS